MSKKPRGSLQKSVQARAREMAAQRVRTADAIARTYVESMMRMIFPGEEVD